MLECDNNREKFQCVDVKSAERRKTIRENKADELRSTDGAASMKTGIGEYIEALKIPE